MISSTRRLDLGNGEQAFLKWREGPDIFTPEAHALKAIAATNTVRVPRVLALREDPPSIVLEWLEPGNINSQGWESLGRQLAQMHRCQHEKFGWFENNYIGSLPQTNTWTEDWMLFWRQKRIEPQLQLTTFNANQRRRIESVCDAMPDMIAVGNDEGASLLHGDLWGGNVHGLDTGEGAVIDPASYYGHREVDLAMAELFGGFNPRFFAAYDESWPRQAGYERRRIVYQLYYLLVHVNLFGGSYVTSTMEAVRKLGF